MSARKVTIICCIVDFESVLLAETNQSIVKGFIYIEGMFVKEARTVLCVVDASQSLSEGGDCGLAESHMTRM
jgi:hypothetical protein